MMSYAAKMSNFEMLIFAKKTKFHDAGGPGTVVSPNIDIDINIDR